MRRFSHVTAVGSLLFMLACGDADNGGGNGSGASGEGGAQDPNPDGISLEVVPARQSRVVGGLHSDVGYRFVLVSFKIVNTSPENLALTPVQFSLLTTGSLSILGDVGASALVDQPCPVDIQVATGGHYSCTIVFSVPNSQDPASMTYTSLGGLKGTSSVPLLPCEWCLETYCDDVMTSVDNCGVCGNAVPECVNGKAVCPAGTDPCGGINCIHLKSDDQNCGACGDVCKPSPDSIFENCDIGSCDLCGCSSGECHSRRQTLQRISCDELCGSFGQSCDGYGGVTIYGQFSYPCGEVACGQVPPASLTGEPFVGISCGCRG